MYINSENIERGFTPVEGCLCLIYQAFTPHLFAHVRPFKLNPLIFPLILLDLSYMNVQGGDKWKTFPATEIAFWSGLYPMFALDKPKPQFIKHSPAGGIVRWASFGLCLMNIVGGNVAWSVRQKRGIISRRCEKRTMCSSSAENCVVWSIISFRVTFGEMLPRCFELKRRIHVSLSIFKTWAALVSVLCMFIVQCQSTFYATPLLHVPIFSSPKKGHVLLSIRNGT